MTENYLGVMFVGGPDKMEPGDTAEVKLALMYFPEESYAQVQAGATFTIRRGTPGRWLRCHFESPAGILSVAAAPSGHGSLKARQ
jgi:hypothetical protein